MKLFVLLSAMLVAGGLTTTAGEHGKASFYSRCSTRTASGERFVPGSLTAAHRTLPFGTRVKVTNLKSGRTTVVRINNRGPYTKGRVIDVTPAAARELGMLKAGVVPVRLEVVEEGGAE